MKRESGQRGDRGIVTRHRKRRFVAHAELEKRFLEFHLPSSATEAKFLNDLCGRIHHRAHREHREDGGEGSVYRKSYRLCHWTALSALISNLCEPCALCGKIPFDYSRSERRPARACSDKTAAFTTPNRTIRFGLLGSACPGKFIIMISDPNTSHEDGTRFRRNFLEITAELGERHFRLIQSSTA